ncbi:MAG: hypothetical protein RMI89_04220 [Gloeomargarita sp. SKYBB_i_bin120]|nr:hypothetical protein [Gloeomargarita sp. SKYG98]MCS7292164.1 hypothetical protein [Gloeomargarita sp. SKYB120]MDW8177725.1 hypothetical protein [Gloeomargarita sp. SKYBB_i_bin120]
MDARTRENDTQLDSFPVELLEDRYQLGHNALYNRLKGLGIKPFKVSRRAYITAQELERLDRLHEFLQQGGTINDFLAQEPNPPTDLSVNRAEIPVNLTHLIGTVADAVAGAVVTSMRSTAGVIADAVAQRLAQLKVNSDPLEYLRTLEEAYRNGWILSTSEVAHLLRVAPRTITEHGERFEDSGFVFVRVGKKRGEVAWRVGKPEELPPPERYQPMDPQTGYPQW